MRKVLRELREKVAYVTGFVLALGTLTLVVHAERDRIAYLLRPPSGKQNKRAEAILSFDYRIPPDDGSSSRNPAEDFHIPLIRREQFPPQPSVSVVDTDAGDGDSLAPKQVPELQSVVPEERHAAEPPTGPTAERQDVLPIEQPRVIALRDTIGCGQTINYPQGVNVSMSNDEGGFAFSVKITGTHALQVVFRNLSDVQGTRLVASEQPVEIEPGQSFTAALPTPHGRGLNAVTYDLEVQNESSRFHSGPGSAAGRG